jgi:hypothetical protein
MIRPIRLLLPAMLGLATLTVGCGAENPYQAAKAAQTATTTTEPTSGTSGIGDNVFLPEAHDVSDCVSTNELPNCGSKDKGGWHMYLVMLVLVLGVAFIAWRVVRLVRRRDAIVNDIADPQDTTSGR